MDSIIPAMKSLFRKGTTIFLLSFYAFGIFCLPMGDFSVLEYLPNMYRNCKATEDKDMTTFDFFTDHLINLDGLFDKHSNGDEQKPHQSNQSRHHVQNPICSLTYFAYSTQHLYPMAVGPLPRTVNFIPINFISEIFHPPRIG